VNKQEHNLESAKKIWIVAAGTGGHIFPGLSIAAEIKKREARTQILFFGTKDRLEEKIIPKHGHQIQFLNAKQWKGRGLVTRVEALWALLKSCVFVFKLINKDRPDFLISIGGYVSMPVGLACWLRNVPLYLVEPNICAGIANRLLSYFAVKAFTIPGSDALDKFFCKTYDTGNPVLGDFTATEIRREAKKLLILGGSQGARILCHIGLSVFSRLKARGVKCELLLQSGDKNLEDANEIKKSLKLGDDCEIRPFIENVSRELSLADVVIARAGAMTITELTLTQVPTIFVPFPAAADDHQRVNAKVLLDAGAARMVDEKQKGFEQNLENELYELMAGEKSYEKRLFLSNGMKSLARPHSAQLIVDKIFSTDV